jgi:nucleotide-binding universal stress UspA family protein
MDILVAVDESQAGERALKWAAGFAARTGNAVEAVRTWAYPFLPGDGLEDADRMDRRTLLALRETAARAGITAEIKTTVLRGPAGPSLLGHIDETHPGMVVVGRRGADTPRTMLGSVSRRIVEAAHVPVVVVSGDDDGSDSFQRIVVGVDGSPHSERALDWAMRIARPLGAELVLVHALGFDSGTTEDSAPMVEASAQILDWAKARAHDAGVRVESLSVAGDPRMVLESVAHERDADLIVVGTRGLGTLGRMLLGSVAGYLAQHVNRPVVVIPPERERPVGVE